MFLCIYYIIRHPWVEFLCCYGTIPFMLTFQLSSLLWQTLRNNSVGVLLFALSISLLDHHHLYLLPHTLPPSLPLITSQSDSVLVKCSTGEYKTPNHPISSKIILHFSLLTTCIAFTIKERGTHLIVICWELSSHAARFVIVSSQKVSISWRGKILRHEC